MAAIPPERVSDYDSSQWSTVAEKQGTFEIKTIQRYIDEITPLGKSREAQNIIRNLLIIRDRYGQHLCEVRGNGDSGLMSFGIALLFHATLYSPDQGMKLLDKTIDLLFKISVNHPELHQDLQFVYSLLLEYRDCIERECCSHQFLEEQLINGKSFMLGFTRILRSIGHEAVKDKEKEKATKNNQHLQRTEKELELIAERIIPKNPGENIYLTAFGYLGSLFNLNVSFVELEEHDFREYNETYLLDQDHTKGHLEPNIIIARNSTYFFVILPKYYQPIRPTMTSESNEAMRHLIERLDRYDQGRKSSS